MRPLKPRLEMTPLAQVVPAATACQTTWPLLQIPNCVAPLHTMAPFDVQPVEPPVLVEGEDGCAGAPVPGEEGMVAWAGEPPVGMAVTVTRVVDVSAIGAALGTTGAALEAPGAKTPPALEAAGEADGLLAAGEDAAAEGWPAAADEGAEEGLPAGVDPLVPQSPVGSFTSDPSDPICSTVPGLGNFKASLVGLLQVVLAMFATSMSGRALNLDLSLAPPLTVMGAQFL